MYRPKGTVSAGGVPQGLAGQGVSVHARQGQTLPLRFDGSETVFLVRTATLMFRVTLPENRRQVVMLLYPGDVFRAAFAPPSTDAQLTAVNAGEVLRLRREAFAKLAAENADIAGYFDDAVARQTARQAIHLASVAHLDCRQKLATFLLELAVYTGTPAPDGSIVFRMPLNRTDIADHLGLNADTLSRTMSRLRDTGLLRQPDRQKAFIRDLAALAALTPAAPSVMALQSGTPDAMPGA